MAADSSKPSSWLVPMAGTLSGCGQVIAEQPLDTIKTRLQSSRFSQTLSPLQLAQSTVRAEGGGALLKGIMPRLLTYPLVKMSLFSLYEYFFARFQSTAAAGACAGAANTAISCPVDVLKSQIQVERLARRGAIVSMGADVRVAFDLVRRNGIAVFYRGFAALILRDSIGYAILYSVYFRGQELQKRHEWARMIPGWTLGGLAGTCFYGVTLPIDRIKIMMQTQPHGQARALLACVAEVRSRGLLAFYRGAGPTLARTFVGQAVGLTVYDLCTRGRKR